jgi:hypothetical protein
MEVPMENSKGAAKQARFIIVIQTRLKPGRPATGCAPDGTHQFTKRQAKENHRRP